jgi:hypothetical protein
MTKPFFEFIHFDAEKSILTSKIKGAITPEKGIYPYATFWAYSDWYIV